LPKGTSVRLPRPSWFLFALANVDGDAGGVEPNVGDVEGREVARSERTAEAEEDHGAVTVFTR
jgi:hypothetical protein